MTGASSCHTAVDVFCLKNTVFIILMDHRFFGCRKNSSHLNTLCTKHKRCCHSSAVRNTTGCDHRDVHCINYLRNQNHCGKLSDCLCSLCNHCICTAAFHTLRKCHRRNNRNNLNSGCFPVSHIFLRASGSCGHNFDALFHDYLCNLL